MARLQRSRTQTTLRLKCLQGFGQRHTHSRWTQTNSVSCGPRCEVGWTTQISICCRRTPHRHTHRVDTSSRPFSSWRACHHISIQAQWIGIVECRHRKCLSGESHLREGLLRCRCRVWGACRTHLNHLQGTVRIEIIQKVLA